MSGRSPSIVDRARGVLESFWRARDGFCPPNTVVYPHQWLWDSCFHAIAWNALADDRALIELASCFDAQLPDGFVPHIRYLEPNTSRGPDTTRSSYIQPPIYAHAAAVIARSGRVVPDDLLSKIELALDWLWHDRLGPDGLLYIVHPWESGADDSPRWDSWVGLEHYDRQDYRAHDVHLVEQTVFDERAVATWSREFVAAPAAFNAFAAHAAVEAAGLLGDENWRRRGAELAAALDAELWDGTQGLWLDRAVVGGGPSVMAPTLDGVFGALVTSDPARAERALAQLVDPERFAAPYGLQYLPADHPRFEPDAYWRGPAWPQLNYMAYVAASRCGSEAVAVRVAEMSVAGAAASGLAEFWNPQTGTGLGAVPQGWGALAAVYPTHDRS